MCPLKAIPSEDGAFRNQHPLPGGRRLHQPRPPRRSADASAHSVLHVGKTELCCWPRPTVNVNALPVVKFEFGNARAMVHQWFVPLDGGGARLLNTGAEISPAASPVSVPVVNARGPVGRRRQGSLSPEVIVTRIDTVITARGTASGSGGPGRVEGQIGKEAGAGIGDLPGVPIL